MDSRGFWGIFLLVWLVLLSKPRLLCGMQRWLRQLTQFIYLSIYCIYIPPHGWSSLGGSQKLKTVNIKNKHTKILNHEKYKMHENNHILKQRYPFKTTILGSIHTLFTAWEKRKVFTWRQKYNKLNTRCLLPGRRERSSPGAKKITKLAPGEPRQGDHSIIGGPPLKRPPLPCCLPLSFPRSRRSEESLSCWA